MFGISIKFPVSNIKNNSVLRCLHILIQHSFQKAESETLPKQCKTVNTILREDHFEGTLCKKCFKRKILNLAKELP